MRIDLRSSALNTKSLHEYLRDANKILVFTGAGISTGSGIPDFRGPSGIWKKRQPVYYQDFMTSEVARIEYWDYKLEGRVQFRDAKPNSSHRALVNLEDAGKLLMIVTQNIDGLHQKAGNSSQKVVELHGTNAEVECQSCGARSNPELHFRYFQTHRKAPLCQCGGFLKPATISFGQALNEDILRMAFAVTDQADLVLALGSTLSVYPAASIPLTAARRGIPYLIVNRGETEQDNDPAITVRIDNDIALVLPAAIEAALGHCH